MSFRHALVSLFQFFQMELKVLFYEGRDRIVAVVMPVLHAKSQRIVLLFRRFDKFSRLQFFIEELIRITLVDHDRHFLTRMILHQLQLESAEVVLSLVNSVYFRSEFAEVDRPSANSEFFTFGFAYDDETSVNSSAFLSELTLEARTSVNSYSFFLEFAKAVPSSVSSHPIILESAEDSQTSVNSPLFRT